MKHRMLSKGLAFAVILLFLGLAIQPSVAVQPETEIDVEPKDYLFQTIIDIANNPEVKEMFEHYDNDLFKFDIDRSVYRKLILRNPRLFFNTLFTKPSMTVEYLDCCYNNGIDITYILGEDKVINTIENVEITDTKLFDEINDIISNDEELLDRLETIKEMNKVTNLNTPIWENYPIICSILLPVLFISGGVWAIFDAITLELGYDSILYYLLMPGYLVSMGLFFATYMFMRFGLECFYLVYK